MSTAAMPPLHFPQPVENFIKIEAADGCYGRGCIRYVVAALRYRAREFGVGFYISREELRDLIATKGAEIFGFSTIDLALSKLRKKGFLESRPDGRGLWIKLLVNTRVRRQSSNFENSPLIRNTRGKQQKLHRNVIAINSTVVEETSPRSPLRQAENPPTPEQPQAKQREPEPNGKNEPENPVGEAVEVWQMAKERAVEFQPWVLAIACQRIRKRFADAERRGERIADTGAYLYQLAVCIGGPPVKRPGVSGPRSPQVREAPRSGAGGLQSAGEIAQRSLFGTDERSVYERALQGHRERHPESGENG